MEDRITKALMLKRIGQPTLGGGISKLAGISYHNQKLEKSSYQEDYSKILKYKNLMARVNESKEPEEEIRPRQDLPTVANDGQKIQNQDKMEDVEREAFDRSTNPRSTSEGLVQDKFAEPDQGALSPSKEMQSFFEEHEGAQE